MVEADPATYQNEDGTVVVRLNHKPGDIAIVSMKSPPDTMAVSLFLYNDGSVNIIGTHPVKQTMEMLEQALDTMRLLGAKGIEGG